MSKASWTEAQFRQYQELMIRERDLENERRTLQTTAYRSEHQTDRALGDLMEGLRKRFHEEQLWTDWIRQLSMWSTLAIISFTTSLSMWSTLAIISFNTFVFFCTFLLRSRESSRIQASVKAIREDLHHNSERQNQVVTEIRAMERLVTALALPPPAPPPPPPAAKDSTDSAAGGEGAGGVEEAWGKGEKATVLGWYIGSAVVAAWLLGRAAHA
ncbi:hypothetical protein T484DRAFT_1793263 [Baffinella frigidus]|nr:hypothetical protein T484DRAFT_1793263 [Cryptophyta sp. CCMP2293]